MNKPKVNVRIVLTTTASTKEAERIGRAVVTKKLAACVNVVPSIVSVFQWQGKVQKSREALLIIKSTKSRYAVLERTIRCMHSYEVPEILALDVKRGYRQYLEWISRETARN